MHIDQKEGIKLFAEEMIAYLENTKESTKKKVLELIYKFSKITRCTKQLFLYTSNEHMNTEIENTISFTIP